MKANSWILIFIVCLSILQLNIIFFPITKVKAISVTYTPLYFYVTESKEISTSEMYFEIKNTNDFEVEINCTVKQIENVNITVNLDWMNKTFQSNEIERNYYTILVESFYLSSIPLIIDCSSIKKTDQNVNKILGAVGIKNWIRSLGDIPASLIDLQIVDQSLRLRESEVVIQYKENNSLSWSILEEFTGSSFVGIMPNGFYQIIAIDVDTGIIGQDNFELRNSTIKQVILELVGFSRFKLIKSSFGSLGINLTINNFVETLTNVEIFAELYFEEELISTTTIEFRSELPKKQNQELVLWFEPILLDNGYYSVIAKIVSNDRLIADKKVDFNYSDAEETGIVLLDEIARIGLGLAVIIMFGVILHQRKSNNNVLYQEKNNNKRKFENNEK